MSKLLLIDTSLVKETSFIEANVDDDILRKVLVDVQNIQLYAILGVVLYDRVIAEAESLINDDSYEMDTLIRNLIYNYIRPFLIYAVTVEFLIVNTYKISNKGIMRMTDASATTINGSELEYLRDFYQNKLDNYKKSLVDFIRDNNLLTDGRQDMNVTSSSGWYIEQPYDVFDLGFPITLPYTSISSFRPWN